MRTPEEVTNEIAALEACKAYVPKITMFGDDNHANIDLQIEYLRGEIDTTASEFYEEYDSDQQSAIVEAENWKNGDEDESPSSGWDHLKPKAEKAPKAPVKGKRGKK